MKQWTTRRMAPINERGAYGQPEPIYAPDLAAAFALARSKWPTASGWACLGDEERFREANRRKNLGMEVP
jgi:hypothetical protein